MGGGGSGIAFCFADRQAGRVGGKGEVLEAFMELYYSKQLTVCVLGCIFVGGGAERGQRENTESEQGNLSWSPVDRCLFPSSHPQPSNVVLFLQASAFF